ncbi:unnamed protein product [Brachionus calyciflorus]|uniref:Uncharacterized protein n=1 Tax=Brachionus calyciflorus TaxID=104777 RepID=A0A814F488_9BILA|nr:unnamed protein product [Brachionus calyciflorus]
MNHYLIHILEDLRMEWNSYGYDAKHINYRKKKILEKIEYEIERNQRIPSRINRQIVSRPIQFTTRSKIINYHNEVVNELDIKFETALSSLSSIEHKEKIEQLNLNRKLMLEELQKVQDENLREENIGKKFKYCFVIEKIDDNIVNLIIANFDHDFISFEPKIR